MTSITPPAPPRQINYRLGWTPQIERELGIVWLFLT